MHQADRYRHIEPYARAGGRPRRAAGFTLLEVLLASALLAFVVAVLLHAIVAGQTQTYHALHASRAIALAEATLDEMLNSSYDQLTSWETDGPEAIAGIDDVYEVAHGVRNDGPYQRFTLQIEVGDEQAIMLPVAGVDDDVEVVGRLVTITIDDDLPTASGEAGKWVVRRFVRKPTGFAPGGSDDDDDDDDSQGNGGGNGNGNGNGNNGNGNGNNGNGNGNNGNNGNGGGNGNGNNGNGNGNGGNNGNNGNGNGNGNNGNGNGNNGGGGPPWW